MATEKQINANRRNCAKSTGPRTAEGKSRSARNALCHGVYAERYLISTEDEAAFHEYSQSLLEHNHPSNPNEAEVVQTMIQAGWRRRRLSELIHSRINDAVQQTIEQHPDLLSDPVRLTSHALAKLEGNGASLLRQESHEFRLAGIFERSLGRLIALRAAEAKQRRNQETPRAESVLAVGSVTFSH